MFFSNPPEDRLALKTIAYLDQQGNRHTTIQHLVLTWQTKPQTGEHVLVWFLANDPTTTLLGPYNSAKNGWQITYYALIVGLFIFGFSAHI